MSLSLQQLLTPTTEADALTSMLAYLDALGFNATSWQSGSMPRTLVQLVARFYADLTVTRVTLTQSRFNDTAEGPFLDLYSKDAYDNDRFVAVATQFTALLDDTVSLVGPFTITLNQLVAQDDQGYTYRSQNTGTLAHGGTLIVTFQAEQAGRDAIPDVGLSIALSTPLVGLPDPLVTAITVQGANAEQDPKLRTRNKAKWATLAYADPQDAYIAWALSADASVTRVYVDDLNPRGPGTIDIYIAGEAGALDPSVATNVLNYIEGITDGISRRPIGSDVDVFSATTANVSITGTLYVAASYSQTVVNIAVNTAIGAFFETLPVGGGGGMVQVASLYAVIMAVSGVLNVHLTAPLTDTSVGATQVPIPVNALNPVGGIT